MQFTTNNNQREQASCECRSEPQKPSNSNSTCCRRRRKRPLPRVWVAALALTAVVVPTSTTMMWQHGAHAFTMTTTTVGRLPGRIASSSSSSRLGSINSRELRSLNGRSRDGLPSTATSRASSIPEVLATSMANYCFSYGGNVKLGSMLADEQENALRQEQHMSFPAMASSSSSSASSRTSMEFSSSSGSSTSSSTSSSSRLQTASTTVVLSPAPKSLLLSKHTFRALGTVANDGDDNNDDTPITLGDGGVNGIQEDISSTNKPAAGESATFMDPAAGPAAAFLPFDDEDNKNDEQYPPPRLGYGYSIQLTDEERKLFELLRKVHQDTKMTTTLRVAGGWVRDKLLATPEFQIFHQYKYQRLTSKFKPSATTATRLQQNQEQPSMGRQGTKVLVQDVDQGPVDIDIALDTMLGREFADHLNAYLQDHGEDAVSVGVVLKNPEKSKHLETATMQVGSFWVDFVNLRAEEYAEDSRIPDLMRIGTAREDAFRRDLTINSLFFNINTGQVEDWTGRGFTDLRRGVVATPLSPLTTLLDDPLRVLRSIRFAARLRFTMGDELVASAKDDRVRIALAQKVSRERVGGEVDLMLRSPDPVGAMKLLVNLNLISTVFPLASCLPGVAKLDETQVAALFDQCHNLMSTVHDHLFDCKVTPPVWCQAKRLMTTHNVEETTLTKDDEARRLLWYASFLKPVHDYAERAKQQIEAPEVSKRASKKANRSIMIKLLVDELKRPGRDAEAVEKIMKASNDMTMLIQSGCDLSATLVLLSDVRVVDDHGSLMCSMRGRSIDSAKEEDPVWEHAMEFRLLCSGVLQRVGGLWRAALMLSLSEQLASLNEGELDYAIEGDVIDESQEERRLGIIEQYDTFAAALQQIGLIGIWDSKPLVDGQELKQVLPYIPRGPAFRDVMDEQDRWMTTHPGASKEPMLGHLETSFSGYTKAPTTVVGRKQKKANAKQN